MTTSSAIVQGNPGTLGSLGQRSLWVLGLLTVLALGAALRLIWVEDIEYKGDEAWTFARVQEIREGGAWPLLGMPSSQKILNPGLSIWVFAALGEIANVEDPTSLARTVQVANVLALLCLTAFVLWIVPAGEREPWLWAVALVSVNPLAVLFHRKIWPPSVSPLLITAFLLCWWYRDRRWGAFGWGVLGACLGQLHGAGFLLSSGFFLWAFLFERRRVAWGSWLIGSGLGVLPMLPWLQYLLSGPEHRQQSPDHWVHMFEGKFWSRWVMEPIGFGIDYALGRDFGDYLRYPLVGGEPTYLMLLLHLAVGLIGAVILLKALMGMVPRLRQVGRLFVGSSSPTAFTLSAALWGYGLVATLSSLPLHRHYMIILFPLQFVWLARMALGSVAAGRPGLGFGRCALALLVVCQALLSMQFLGYIHAKTHINGDYGSPYGAQVQPTQDPEGRWPGERGLAAR